jgi:hypothetical protein
MAGGGGGEISAGTDANRPAGGAPGPSSQSSAATIGVSGGRLVLGGRPYAFVGVNAFQLATDWGTNAGCGTMVSDADLSNLFASLAPNSLVRFWAFQGTMATSVNTHQLDWAPLDRVFQAAAAHGQRLVVTLTDQSGSCDGMHWQDPSWYNGAFQQVFNKSTDSDGRGLTPLSYWDYLQAVVNRYKSSPALGMWEPISEAEASTCDGNYGAQPCWGHTSCPSEAAAAAALRHFFDVVGGEIHALDPNHLVESGLLGGGQCGTAQGDFQYVSASPGIDVLSYHDYYVDAAIGGDAWNGIGVRLSQAAALGKPIIAGEMGLQAASQGSCSSLADRADQMRSKIQSQFTAGTEGALVWNWAPSSSHGCDYNTWPGDPLMSVVQAGPPAA